MTDAGPTPRPATRSGWPVPSPRALSLLALGLIPALLSGAFPVLGGVALGWDLLIAGLMLADLLRAPSPERLRLQRALPETLRVGVEETVTVTVLGAEDRPLTVRDTPDPALHSTEHRQRLPGGREQRTFSYPVRAGTSGRYTFGDVHLRVPGPWGLMQRQLRVAQAVALEARPDLRALSAEALHLSRAHAAEARRRRSALAHGQTFHSLRAYRPGEDVRSIDWKATARRGEPIVRVRRPEQHQPILLLLDCGRLMAGQSGQRRRLELAMEAILRLSAASLAAGDRVGLVAYAGKVRVHLPPRPGQGQLRAIAEAMVGLEADFEEADHGRALKIALAKGQRRSLIVFFTDLLDAESAAPLLAHVHALRSRHLPLIASLRDLPLQERAAALPTDLTSAYERHAAGRVTQALERTLHELQRAGAHVVHAPPETFGAGSVNAYLELKARGVL